MGLVVNISITPSPNSLHLLLEDCCSIKGKVVMIRNLLRTLNIQTNLLPLFDLKLILVLLRNGCQQYDHDILATVYIIHYLFASYCCISSRKQHT